MGAFSWTLDTVWIRIERNVCGVTTNPLSGVTSDVCLLVFVPPWAFQWSPRRGWKFVWWWDREGCKGEFALPLVISSYWRMLSSVTEVRGSQTGPLWTGWRICLPSAECCPQWLKSGDHKEAHYEQADLCACCRLLSSVIEVRGSQNVPLWTGWPVCLLQNAVFSDWGQGITKWPIMDRLTCVPAADYCPQWLR